MIKLNAFQLKIIALISMTIDHIGYFLFPNIIILRIMGRLSFVIFAYMLVNGYLHTSNKVKHGLIILGLGILFDIILLCINSFITTNIFTTLGLGYFLVMYFDEKKYYLVIPILIIGAFLPLDYGLYGLLLILSCYLCFNNISLLLIINIGLIMILSQFNIINNLQLYSSIGILLLYLYNNKKGQSLKYFFYAYYPLHIIFLSVIANYK
ncbi:MAG: conjugal transfer protein TraX [Bacilli bacterium]|jgi:hypothetical protein|nr:conjugal transfer protein TraX [Bacilli bacterium]